MTLRLPVPTSTWIPRELHRPVVEALLRHGIVRFDNGRNLPLANGGKTDIYLDVRIGRSKPEASADLTQLYTNPMRWLQENAGVSRFLEVPEAVSGIAALVSNKIQMPYVTIRKTPKAGRVSDANAVGELNRGDIVALLDDVITDGASKLPAIEVCTKRGVQLNTMVVLCDRQQGWEKYFSDHGISIRVWAGLTLHDIRRELIGMGEMLRCEKEIQDNNPIIIALDDKSWGAYLPLLDELRPTGCTLKVNDMGFNEGIARLMPELSVYGEVMWDFKFHDIPNTVANACKHLTVCPPWAVTVQGSGGGPMVGAARKTLPKQTKVLAITVLTSMDPETCEEIYGRRPLDQVLKIAKIAREGGADGFVCSPEEIAPLRTRYPEALIITPGVRSPGKDAQDQKRVGTPGGALLSGANRIVIGRQITQAPDPAREVRRLLQEELIL